MLISCPWIFFRKLYGSSLSIPCSGTNQKAGREKVGNFWDIQTTPSSCPLIPCTQGTDQKAWGIRLNLTDDIKHPPKWQGSGMVLGSQLRKTGILILVLLLSINMNLSNLSRLSVTWFLHLKIRTIILLVELMWDLEVITQRSWHIVGTESLELSAEMPFQIPWVLVAHMLWTVGFIIPSLGKDLSPWGTDLLWWQWFPYACHLNCCCHCKYWN